MWTAADTAESKSRFRRAVRTRCGSCIDPTIAFAAIHKLVFPHRPLSQGRDEATYAPLVHVGARLCGLPSDGKTGSNAAELDEDIDAGSFVAD